MKTLLFLIVLLCSSLAFPATQRVEIFPSPSPSPSWAPVVGVSASKLYQHVLVENYTDGDIEIAFGSTTYPDFTIVQGVGKQIDSGQFLGSCYVRVKSGTGAGQIIVRAW